MIVIPNEEADSYCIDTTEVTRAQYAAWLALGPNTAGQAPECSWNSDFTPSCEWPQGSKGDHPVVCVDWCDANAYCRAVGKRLCGKIGGGASAPSDASMTSQWAVACSSGGQTDYAYGSTYDAQSCNVTDMAIGTTLPCGSLITCQSSQVGYTGVYDLIGNVHEWEDRCNSGSTGDCAIRGGAFDKSVDCYAMGFASRSQAAANLGFRCCSEP